MIPYIERTYNVNYAQVSVLFVCTFLGHVVAAGCAGTLSRKLGYGNAMLVTMAIELAVVGLR